MTATALSLLLLALPPQADRDEDLVLTLGVKLRELSAVAVLLPAQEKPVADLVEALSKELGELRAKASEQGLGAMGEEYLQWQERARDRLRQLLRPEQRALYDAHLARKKRLAAEFDKSLFGIPPVTELKLRLALDDAAAEPLYRAADAGVDAIRKRVTDLRKQAAKPEDLVRAVNDERRTAIERMIECVKGGQQAKVKDYVKDFLRTPEAKLMRADKATLDRLQRGLDIKDATRQQSARRLLAAILMHRFEVALLRHGQSRDLITMIVTRRPEAEMWVRMAEYTSLISIHERRLRDLNSDAKSYFTSQEIARLVSEGALE